MTTHRVIKRYANRKLYDTEQSKYITLKDVALLVEGGVDVQILDNSNQEDITRQTLAHILREAEKKQRKTMPLSSLKQILQSGGDFLHRKITHPVSTIRDDAEERVQRIRDEAEHKIRQLRGKANLDEVRDAIQDLVNQTQENLEDLQKKVEERYQHLLTAARVPTPKTRSRDAKKRDISDEQTDHIFLHMLTKIEEIEARLLTVESSVLQLLEERERGE